MDPKTEWHVQIKIVRQLSSPLTYFKLYSIVVFVYFWTDMIYFGKQQTYLPLER